MDDGGLVGGGGGYEYEGKHELLLVERRMDGARRSARARGPAVVVA